MTGILSYQIRYYDEHETQVSGIEEVVTPTDEVTLQQMQDAVGGLICTLARFPSPFRPNVVIDSYVNDEGLLIRLPILMRFDGAWGVDGHGSFAGNVVFVGADGPESVPLTDEEINYIRDNFTGSTFTVVEKQQVRWEL